MKETGAIHDRGTGTCTFVVLYVFVVRIIHRSIGTEVKWV